MNMEQKQEKLNKKPLVQRIAVLGPIVAGICWGGCGFFVRGLTESGLDNPTIVFTRDIFGTVLTLIYLLAMNRQGLKVKLKHMPSIFAVSLFGALLFNFVYNIAVNELSLSLASVLLATAPAFVLLISAVIYKEKISAKKVICMILAFIGCAMLSGILDPGATVHFSRLGLVMGVATAICNGAYILTSKNVMTKGYGSMTICFYTFLMATIILIPFVDWQSLSEFMAAGPANFMIKGPAGAFIYLLLQSLLSSILPSAVYMASMKYVDAGKVAILEGGAEPTTSLLMDILIYSTMPSLFGFAGMIISIVAIMVLARE